MDPSTEATVRLAIELDVPVERAYQVFTQRYDLIKPREHNLLDVEVAETVLEAWSGGRVYDRGVDGSTCTWGRVLVADAPHRLVFTWDIDPRWQLETDPARTSEVEVRFEATSATSSRVEIEHRHLDRHGDGWEGERDAVGGEQGWPVYLRRFREQLAPVTG